MSLKRGRVVALMGPTAAGKTALAIQLRQALGGEIISVDSALIYRSMDIGTAKPSAEELALAPHRLIDIIEPWESYSAARFRSAALAEITQILDAGRTPLLVGGTMLYFRALFQGLSPLPAADAGVRQALEAEAAQLGWAALHQRLTELDPLAGARIHPNDPQRICRALEVYELSGRPMSAQFDDPGDPFPWDVVKLVVAPMERASLHAAIARRFHQMLELGFEDEVQGLLAPGRLSAAMPSMRCVGYRQMLGYLQGEMGREEMIEKAIIATRQLAKRQMTWLRAEADTHWLHGEKGDILAQALKIIGNDRT